MRRHYSSDAIFGTAIASPTLPFGDMPIVAGVDILIASRREYRELGRCRQYIFSPSRRPHAHGVYRMAKQRLSKTSAMHDSRFCWAKADFCA